MKIPSSKYYLTIFYLKKPEIFSFHFFQEFAFYLARNSALPQGFSLVIADRKRRPLYSGEYKEEKGKYTARENHCKEAITTCVCLLQHTQHALWAMIRLALCVSLSQWIAQYI